MANNPFNSALDAQLFGFANQAFGQTGVGQGLLQGGLAGQASQYNRLFGHTFDEIRGASEMKTEKETTTNPKPTSIREELQKEIDEWLEDI